MPSPEKTFYEDKDNTINETDVKEVSLCEESYRKGFEEGKILSKNNMDKEKYNIIKLIEEKILDIEKDINNKIRNRFDIIFMEAGEKIYQIAFSMFLNLMRQYGEKESKEYIKNVIPLLKTRDKIKITCCENLYKNIHEYIINRSDAITTTVLDENLQKGDFKIFWDNGILTHDVRIIMEDIEKKLNNSNVEK